MSALPEQGRRPTPFGGVPAGADEPTVEARPRSEIRFRATAVEPGPHEGERTPTVEFDPRIAIVRELYARGDAEGALRIGAMIGPFASELGGEDELPTVARDIHARTARELVLGDVPRLSKSFEELAAMSLGQLDPRMGLLLAYTDGSRTLGEIAEAIAMPAPEARMLLQELIVLEIVTPR